MSQPTDSPKGRARRLRFTKRGGSHEFPAAIYVAPKMPTACRAWEDVSWHNDACPSFSLLGPGEGTRPELRIWIEDKRPAMREGVYLYSLALYSEGAGCGGDCTELLSTDSLVEFNRLLAALGL